MAYQRLSLDHVVTVATGFKGPKGVTVDREGNVYGGGTDGVIRKLSLINRLVVLDPTGTVSTLLDDPEGKKTRGPTNYAFGGSQFTDLNIAHLEADHIAKIGLGRRGHPLYDQR